MMLILMMVMGLAGCGGAQDQEAAPAAGDKMKVGFMYIGPVGDAGWTYSHDLGREYLVEKMPDVEPVIYESIADNDTAKAEATLREMAEKGCKVVFATSFGYMDPVQRVAKEYPDVVFVHCSGFKTADNVSTYFGRMYQPRYLSGLIAGKMTEKNEIGYVAAHPIPEVIRGINAFTLGVRAVNPEAKVRVVWTNTWYDPPAEKEAAKSLLESGVDVIAQHQDTPGPQQAAEEAGAYAIGYNTNMREFAPNANLTSPIWNWGPYYTKVVQDVKDGQWKTEEYWGGLKDNVVELGEIAPSVPEEVKTMVKEKEEAIKNGEFDVFDGPIKGQDGQLKVTEGQKMTDKEMLEMMWFVEGVEGEIPSN